jgi:hypothetical protein
MFSTSFENFKYYPLQHFISEPFSHFVVVWTLNIPQRQHVKGLVTALGAIGKWWTL